MIRYKIQKYSSVMRSLFTLQLFREQYKPSSEQPGSIKKIELNIVY